MFTKQPVDNAFENIKEEVRQAKLESKKRQSTNQQIKIIPSLPTPLKNHMKKTSQQ